MIAYSQPTFINPYLTKEQEVCINSEEIKTQPDSRYLSSELASVFERETELVSAAYKLNWQKFHKENAGIGCALLYMCLGWALMYDAVQNERVARLAANMVALPINAIVSSFMRDPVYFRGGNPLETAVAEATTRYKAAIENLDEQDAVDLMMFLDEHPTPLRTHGLVSLLKNKNLPKENTAQRFLNQDNPVALQYTTCGELFQDMLEEDGEKFFNFLSSQSTDRQARLITAMLLAPTAYLDNENLKEFFEFLKNLPNKTELINAIEETISTVGSELQGGRNFSTILATHQNYQAVIKALSAQSESLDP